MSKNQLSVCIIAKNEERFLRGCLEKLKPHGFEIVVVDTGSTDGTVEIAKEFTEHVYSFPWINDFSAAKNFAADKASNDWIISLDCDEYLKDIDIDEVSALLTKNPLMIGSISLENLIRNGEGIGKSMQKVFRIYNKKHVHFEGIIHEQLRRFDGEKVYGYIAPVSVIHYGYYLSEEELKAKNERNISMLLEQLKSCPKEPYYYFQLGQSYAVLNDYEKVFEYLSKGLEYDPNPEEAYTDQMLIDYGTAMLNTGRYALALNMETLYDSLKDYSDYLFLLGRIYYANNQLFKAIQTFTQATAAPKCIVMGTNSFFPLHSMALIYEQIGEKELADSCNKQVEALVGQVQM